MRERVNQKMNGIRHALAICTIAFLANIAAGDAVQSNGTLRMALDLADGSRIVGTPAFSSIPFQSAYAKTDIRLEQILQIAIGADHETVSLETTDGDVLTGVLNMGSVELTTLFGKVSAGMGNVRGMQFRANAGFALPANLKEDLVLHYTFDKDENGRVTDESGKNNTGQVQGASWVRQGNRGGVMQFDGVDDHIIVADSDSLDMRSLTLAAWICVADIPSGNKRGGGMIMEKRPHDACWKLIHYDSGRLQLTGGSAHNEPSARGLIVPGKWIHIVATISESQGVLYLNGSQVHAAPVTPLLPTSGEICIGMGRNLHPSDDHFKGFMDDIMIFNRALSADEVNTLYKSR